MAKKKLTDKQWVKVEKRFVNGESARSLSIVYGVPESTIRYRFSALSKKVKDVAQQIVRTEDNLKSLPKTAQILAQDLAAQLRAVSANLSNAALYGSKTACKLSELASSQCDSLEKIGVDSDGSAVIEIDPEKLNTVNALSKVANESSAIGLNLLKANKEFIDKNEDIPSELDYTSLSDDEITAMIDITAKIGAK